MFVGITPFSNGLVVLRVTYVVLPASPDGDALAIVRTMVTIKQWYISFSLSKLLTMPRLKYVGDREVRRGYSSSFKAGMPL